MGVNTTVFEAQTQRILNLAVLLWWHLSSQTWSVLKLPFIFIAYVMKGVDVFIHLLLVT
jgi:hypothetical protein